MAEESSSVYIPRLLQNDPDLRHLALVDKMVTDLSAEHLARALLSNRCLRTLSLRSNRIHDDGAVCLADMLLVNTTLTKLDLSHNEIGEVGGSALVKAAHGNTSLIELTLENTLLTPDLREQVAYWIAFNVHPSALKRALPGVQRNVDTITSLDLSGDTGLRIYTEASAQLIADALRGSRFVKRVVLDKNFRGDGMCSIVAAALGENASVTAFSLVSCTVGPTGAQALAQALEKNKSLSEIDLTDNEVGDAGVRAFLLALQSNDQMVKINLRNNAVSDVLLRKMDAALTLNAQPPKLKHLLPRLIANDPHLRDVELKGEVSAPDGPVIEDLRQYCGNSSALLLADALQYNSTVRTLNLGFNHVGPEGAKGLALMLKSNQSITKLNLRGNHVADEGARALVDALQLNDSIVELDLRENGLSHKLNTQLRHALLLNRQPTKLKVLLPFLYQGAPDVRDVSFAEFARDALGSALSGGTAHSTTGIAQYKEPRLNDDSVELLCRGLRHNTMVRALNLRGQDITDKSLQHIAEMLKTNHTITSLNLADNLDITNDGISHLLTGMKVNDSVVEVDMGIRHRISDEWLAEMKWAAELNAQPRLVKQAVPRVSSNEPSLRLLAFPGTDEQGRGITDSSIGFLVGALGMNTHVTSLDISQGRVGNRGAERLGDYLRTNKTLWHLNVSGNDIGIDGADHIAMALRANNTLRSLNIASNHIMEEGGRALHDALMVNNAIVQIELDHNQVSATMMRAVSAVLRLNAQPGVVKAALIQVLRDDRTVLELNFESLLSTPLSDRPPIITYADETALHQIDDGAAEVAVHCLRNNHHVQSLSLTHGAITAKGCAMLASLLKSNPHITYVDVSHNDIADAGIGPVVDMLRANNTLINFNISHNRVSEHMESRLMMLLQLNSEPRAVKQFCLRVWNADPGLRCITLSLYDGERYCDDSTCEVLTYFLTTFADQCLVDTLDLAHNFITDAGCVHLGRLLQRNNTITTLNLQKNSITDEGLRELLRGVQKNTRLQTLDLRGNADVRDSIMQQQLEAKLKDNQRQATFSYEPGRTRTTTRRKTSKPLLVEDTTDYFKKMQGQIMADAMADCITVLRR